LKFSQNFLENLNYFFNILFSKQDFPEEHGCRMPVRSWSTMFRRVDAAV